MANHTAILSLGSNMGPLGPGMLKVAMQDIEEHCHIECSSSIYSTPPLKGKGNPYHNAVIKVTFDKDPQWINIRFKSIEVNRGRTEISRYREEVPIDIDMVILDGEILRPEDFAANYFQIGYKEII